MVWYMFGDFVPYQLRQEADSKSYSDFWTSLETAFAKFVHLIDLCSVFVQVLFSDCFSLLLCLPGVYGSIGYPFAFCSCTLLFTHPF